VNSVFEREMMSDAAQFTATGVVNRSSRFPFLAKVNEKQDPVWLRQKENSMAVILAVDDSTSLRQMVSYTLKEAGYEVMEAVDGVDALNAAKEKEFDLAITDVNMPNMDGITLLKELRSLPQYKHKPILMLTTEAGDEKKQEGKAAGATGWLVKPFDPETLLSVIKKVLG